MDEAEYIIVRQRAGPLVKVMVTDNYRYLRRYGPAATQKRCGPALSRTSTDKLELRLALFGFDGIFYTLTFAPEHLPEDLSGVIRVWDAFLHRLQRWAGGKRPDYYVYRVEGLHGDHRYHIHAFLRDQDFPPAVVRYLWDWGEAYDVPWTRERVLQEHGYRGLAVYFTKEEPEVGRHPWSCSRALRRLLPEPEVRASKTADLRIPRGAVRLPIKGRETPTLGDWGVFSYAKYLEN